MTKLQAALPQKESFNVRSSRVCKFWYKKRVSLLQTCHGYAVGTYFLLAFDPLVDGEDGRSGAVFESQDGFFDE